MMQNKEKIMILYKFKTFTTSYYFPRLSRDKEYMYGLYSAYGGKLSKLYWYLFRKYKFVRALTKIDSSKVDFPYKKIKEIDGTDCLMSFNMGSPGVEQKISILGFDKQSGKPFFAKFSEKPAAMALTKNEIDIYNVLSGTGLCPQLFQSKIDKDFVYLKAEYINGKRPQERTFNDNILNLCLRLKNYHLTEKQYNSNGLLMCLSHGDFCPWNMLEDEGKLRLIDWEMAKDRTLGFDLFTYICQVSILFTPNKSLLSSIDEHNDYIKKFFADCRIEDYIPYLKAFALEKAEYEKGKSNKNLSDKYNELNDAIK